jgi:hypothetical protein
MCHSETSICISHDERDTLAEHKELQIRSRLAWKQDRSPHLRILEPAVIGQLAQCHSNCTAGVGALRFDEELVGVIEQVTEERLSFAIWEVPMSTHTMSLRFQEVSILVH